mgnify:CR=1 FL=1
MDGPAKAMQNEQQTRWGPIDRRVEAARYALLRRMERATYAVPRLRQRLVRTPLGCGGPKKLVPRAPRVPQPVPQPG